jgi:hypothetical protein
MRTCKVCNEIKDESLFRYLGVKPTQCKSCEYKKNQERYQLNKEKYNIRIKEYYQENKEEIKEKSSKNYYENLEERQEYFREYYHKNKSKKQAYNTKYKRERGKSDPIFKAKDNARSRGSKAIRRNSWPRGTEDLLDCSFDKFKIQIESRFQNGMTWENYGKWHVDHIIPLSSAKNLDELIPLCHYTNLQPLWAIDNIKKGNKCI